MTKPNTPAWEHHDDAGTSAHLWRCSDGSWFLALTDRTTGDELIADMPGAAAAELALVITRAADQTTEETRTTP